MLEKEKKLYAFIKNPNLLRSDDTDFLEKLAVKYPYFGTIQSLLLKKYQLQKDARYEAQLKRTAFFSSSRSRLHELLQQEDGPLFIIKDWSPTVERELDEQKELVETNAHNGSFSLPDRKEDIAIVKLKSLGDTADPAEQLENKKEEKPEEPTLLNPVTEMDLAEDESVSDPLENQILAGAGEAQVLKELEEDEIISHETRLTLLHWLNKLAKKGPAVVKELENLYEEYSIRQVKKRNIDQLPDIRELFEPKREVTLEEIVDKASRSIDFGAIPVSETLAGIYEDQGNLQMAIEVFKKLILKYPEKSTFFANRIKELNI